jgi:hypothetical protein
VADARDGEESTQAHAARTLRDRAASLVTATTPLVAKELAVTGRDLMQELALTPGPRVGRLIDHLLDRALEDPGVNTRERLLELARERLATEV